MATFDWCTETGCTAPVIHGTPLCNHDQEETMITSADIPDPKPEPNHRPLPVFSSQAGLASFTTDRENGSAER